jgi:hypothetical protein
VGVKAQCGAMSGCTVAEGICAELKVQGGAMSDCKLGGVVGADVKYKVGLYLTVEWQGELVWM